MRKFWKSYERVRYEFFNENYRMAILKLAADSDLYEILDKLDAPIDEYAASENCEPPSIYYYQQASGFLARMQRIGFDIEFSSYIEDLTRRFWRRRALIDEIRKVAI